MLQEVLWVQVPATIPRDIVLACVVHLRSIPPHPHSCLWEGGQGRQPSSSHEGWSQKVHPSFPTSAPSANSYVPHQPSRLRNVTSWTAMCPEKTWGGFSFKLKKRVDIRGQLAVCAPMVTTSCIVCPVWEPDSALLF